DCVIRAPILNAHLSKLAGPVSQNQRLSRVGERRVLRNIGTVVTYAPEPTSCELIVARDVKATRGLQAVGWIASVPHDLGAAHEGLVNRALQRLPANRSVHAVQGCLELPEVDAVNHTGTIL